MKEIRRFILVPLLALGLAACASKLVVQSNPAGADVYFTAPRSDRKVKMGVTPFQITDETMKSQIKLDPYQLEYFQLDVEKEGFQTKQLLVPGMRFGQLETTVYVALTPAKEGLAAKELLQFLINAQQFAQSEDFYRAHAEVDKALKIDPKFARALSMQGAVYFVEKNYSESLKWYEQSLAVDPQQQDVVKMVTFLRKKMKEQK